MTNASFKALKEKVGVDDIAYSLGYRLKREAGVGKCQTAGVVTLTPWSSVIRNQRSASSISIGVEQKAVM